PAARLSRNCCGSDSRASTGPQSAAPGVRRGSCPLIRNTSLTYGSGRSNSQDAHRPVPCGLLISLSPRLLVFLATRENLSLNPVSFRRDRRQRAVILGGEDPQVAG